MKSIFLVAQANLRRRKKQNLMVGLSIFLSVVLMTTAIGILGGIQKPFDVMFDRLHASHILLFYDYRQEDSEKITEWFSKQPEVDHVSEPRNYFLITEPLTFKNEKINMMIYLTEFSGQNLHYDSLLNITSGNRRTPGWGEVWIPKHMSTRYGISIGDTIKLPLSQGFYPLAVSAVIVDPHYVSGLINPNRMWIAPGMLPFMVQIGELNNVILGIRLKHKADIEKIWQRFRNEIEYGGSNLQYSLFKSVFTSVYKIIGLVIIIFSVLSMVMAGYIISSIIHSSVMSDSRLTGTLKAIGFKPSQATSIYLIQYSLIAWLAIPAGLWVSYFSIRMMLQSISSSLGVINLSFPFFGVFICSAVFFAVIISVLVIVNSSRAGRIQPASALRSLAGDTNIARKRHWFPFKMENHSLSAWMALRLIFDKPAKSVLTLISLVITTFVVVFSVNSANSFSKIMDHKTLWGFDNSDLQVLRSEEVLLPLEHKKLLGLLREEKSVQETVPFSYYDLTAMLPGDSVKEEIPGKVFEMSPSKLGLTNIEGEHPEGEREISLCIGTSQKLGKKVGDSIDVIIENEKKVFLVSGIYQDISNMGKGFRLSSMALQAVNPLFEPDRYALVLKDRRMTDEFKSKLQKRLGEAIKIELTVEDQLAFSGITKSVTASIILIALFFVCILIISVFNDVYLSIWENRKTLGILSLSGFTSIQLKKLMIWKTFMLTVCGILIGIPLVLISEPFLMSAITSGFGVVHFPLIVTYAGTVLALILLICVALLSSWKASDTIRKINTLILVNE